MKGLFLKDKNDAATERKKWKGIKKEQQALQQKGGQGLGVPLA